MKIILEPMWFWYINVILLIVLIYLLLTYFNKDHSFTDIWAFVQVAFLILIIVFVLSVFALGYIEIAVVSGPEEDGTMIATLLNGFIIGAYILSLGFVPTMSDEAWQQVLKVMAILTFALFSVAGFGHIGIRVTFTDMPILFGDLLPFESLEDLFVYHVFQSNAHHGGMFMLMNLHVLTTIYLATFITESEMSA